MSKFNERIEKFVIWLGNFSIFQKFFSWIASSDKNHHLFLIVFNALVLSVYLTAAWTPWIFIVFTLIIPVLLLHTIPLIGPMFNLVEMARSGRIGFWPFSITIFLMIINHICVFATLYMVTGTVVDSAGTPIQGLWKHFYFSTVTYTTLGYGNLTPASLGTEIVATIEAILGFATFAFMVAIVATLPSDPE